MTSLPATSEASHHYLEWPCEAVIEALESTDLLSVWLGRRIETIVAEGNPLAAWQHQHYAPKAHELFLELGPQLDRVCLSALQIDDAHLAQEWFFKLQEGDASFAQLAAQSLGNSRDSGGHLGPLRVEDLQPPLDRLALKAQPGVVQPPLRLPGGRFIVLRLDSRQPAQFDDTTCKELMLRLHRQWLTEAIATLRATNPEPGSRCLIPLP